MSNGYPFSTLGDALAVILAVWEVPRDSLELPWILGLSLAATGQRERRGGGLNPTSGSPKSINHQMADPRISISQIDRFDRILDLQIEKV